jgi:hypothetical protein
MDEEDVLDQAELPEQDGADQPIEVTPGHQSVALSRHHTLLVGPPDASSPWSAGCPTRLIPT